MEDYKMYQYFKTLQQVADTDKREFKNIKDLTIALMENSGYHRERKPKVSHNGEVEYTKYVCSYYDKWDEPLVARWLLFYKNKFLAKFYAQPNLIPLQADIIQRTFHYVFQSLDLDKVKSESNGFVTACFNRMLQARLGEAFYVIGTPGRAERLKDKTQRNAMQIRNLAALESISMDEATEENGIQFSDGGESIETNPFVMQLYSVFDTFEPFRAQLPNESGDTYKTSKKRYENLCEYRNSIGKRLLEAMLNASQQVNYKADGIQPSKKVYTKEDLGYINPSKICDYMQFYAGEVVDGPRKQFVEAALENAYIKICKALYDEIDSDAEYDWKNINTKFTIDNSEMEQKAKRGVTKAMKVHKESLQSMAEVDEAHQTMYIKDIKDYLASTGYTKADLDCVDSTISQSALSYIKRHLNKANTKSKCTQMAQAEMAM